MDNESLIKLYNDSTMTHDNLLEFMTTNKNKEQALQDGLLWHTDYFELKAIKTLQSQDTLLSLP